MLAAGGLSDVGDRLDFDLVHGHELARGQRCDHLARRFDAPPGDDDPRDRARPCHQGWVNKHPQSYIHGVERWITTLRPRARLLDLHAGAGRRRLRVGRGPGRGDPERDRPDELQPQVRRGAPPPARRVREPDESLVLLVGRLVYEKDSSSRWRRCGDHPAAALTRDSSSPDRAPTSRSSPPGRGARAKARDVRRLDRRRRPPLPLLDRLTSAWCPRSTTLRPGRPRGDGLELPLHRRRHRRAARGRPARRGRAPLPRARPRVPRRDDPSGSSDDAKLCRRLTARRSST